MQAVVKNIEHKNYIADKIYNGIYKELDDKTKEFLNNLYIELGYNSYISILKKQKATGLSDRKVIRWSVNDLERLAYLQGETDLYITPNTFVAPYKCKDKYLHRLNALYLDLDYYKVEHLKDLTPTQFIGLLELEVDFPRPSYYISSGQGLYIIFLLTDTKASKKAKKFWRKLQKELIDRFIDFGIDQKVKDPTRVLRLPTSIHSWTENTVEVIESPLFKAVKEPVRYSLDDIATFFWGFNPTKEEKENNKKERKKSKQIKSKNNYVKLSDNLVKIQNYYTLNRARTEDIKKIVELRKGNVIGFREVILFLYRLHLAYCDFISEEDTFDNQVLELNNCFVEPLTEDEALKSTMSAISSAKVFMDLQKEFREQDTYRNIGSFYKEQGGCYLYKNSTIVDLLEITEEEQKHLKVLITQKEKNRRKRLKYIENKELYAKKNKKAYSEIAEKNKRDKDIMVKKIKELFIKGYTKQDIAKKLNISRSTVQRVLK